MKKILTILASFIILVMLTGCNIECARRANPDCIVFPAFGNESHKYVMFDTVSRIVKLVRISDSGKIVSTYGSLTLSEYDNNELQLKKVTLGEVVVESPIHWAISETSWQFYISNNRIMMFDRRDGETRQVLHFDELEVSRVSTASNTAGHSETTVDSIVVTNYVTVTNYVNSSDTTYNGIDFEFHD